jgi:hypothetical protein
MDLWIGFSSGLEDSRPLDEAGLSPVSVVSHFVQAMPPVTWVVRTL